MMIPSRFGIRCLAALGLSLAIVGFVPAQTRAEEPIWISSLDVAKADQDFGVGRADRSVENHPLTVGGRHFDKGFGTHANSRLAIALNRAGRRFHAFVGVDDEVSGSAASVEFQLIGDGKPLWKSGVLRAGQAAVEATVDISKSPRFCSSSRLRAMALTAITPTGATHN